MNKLPVPENISLRTELWRGFGWPEAVKSGIVCGIAMVALIAFSLVHQGENDGVIFTAGIVLAIGFCVGFFGKIPNSNQSIFDFIKKQAVYKKEQQAFFYCKRKETYYIVQEDES